MVSGFAPGKEALAGLNAAEGPEGRSTDLVVHAGHA